MTLTLAGSSLSVAQGASGTMTITIARSGGFTGAVSLAVEGAPSGVTGTFSPATIGAGQTSSTLTLAAGSSAAAGQTSITVRATGTGVEARTATFSLNVSAAAQPDFSLAVSPATVSVKQGETSNSTVNITRSGGFTGGVALSATGMPTGVAVSLPSGTTTGNSTELTISATGSAAAGSYTITLTGTADGITGNRTATLAVTVSESGGGNPTGSIAWEFCGPDSPIWLAVQDGTGPWKRVTASNNVYRFDISSDKGGVAFVRDEGDGRYATMVQFGTADELEALGADQCVSDSRKSVKGTVAGLGLTDLASINLGGAASSANGAQASFTLENVPGGKRDLVAGRTKIQIGAGGVSMDLDRLIIRRDIDAAPGSTLPVLDFGGSEAFAPEKRNVTVTGGNGHSLIATGMYMTANTPGAALLFAETTPSASAVRSFAVVPSSRQRTGDLHMLVVSAYPGGTLDPTGATQVRSVVRMFSGAADQTVALGPDLVMPSLTVLGPGRFRVKINKQAEYSRYWTATFAGTASGGGTGNNATLTATAGYVGDGASVSMDIPDFTSTAGWNSIWFPSGSLYWQTSASGWEGNSITEPQLDGSVVRTAMRSGKLNPT